VLLIVQELEVFLLIKADYICVYLHILNMYKYTFLLVKLILAWLLSLIMGPSFKTRQKLIICVSDEADNHTGVMLGHLRII